MSIYLLQILDMMVKNLLKNDVNDSLKKIGKLSKGKEFKAEISLENGKGWFIQKVLND